ncbi:hypothetical protein C8R47DRAFT_1227289 [Mycena vitilis]|nr:hypothetical protein C8R47DRAFT_1227289 [Mycena vitilis]
MDLEASLVALKQEKKAVHDRLTAYVYPVLTLPNEITSEIFIQLLPVYPKRPEPIDILSLSLVCRICRQWREIALATPTLWRAVSFMSMRHPAHLEKAVRILELFLIRSRLCMLSIELRESGPVNMVGMLFSMIAEHCARWEHLYIDNPLDRLFTGNLSLPCPRTLKLGWVGNSTAAPTVLAAPLLQKVGISTYYDIYVSILPWPQITVLSVGAITIQECAGLLPQLVSVVHCSLRVAEIGNFEDSATNWNVTLKHLETLILRSDWLYLQNNILAALTLPALRRLHLSSAHSTYALTQLVSRSGCILQELCIPGINDASSDMCRAAFPATAMVFSHDGRLAIENPFLNEPDSEDDTRTDSSDEGDSDSSY